MNYWLRKIEVEKIVLSVFEELKGKMFTDIETGAQEFKIKVNTKLKKIVGETEIISVKYEMHFVTEQGNTWLESIKFVDFK